LQLVVIQLVRFCYELPLRWKLPAQRAYGNRALQAGNWTSGAGIRQLVDPPNGTSMYDPHANTERKKERKKNTHTRKEILSL
jgi:hypothetical protein